MRRFAAAAALILGALGLAACDDDDPPSKADFADQAEKICSDAEKRLAKVGQDATEPAEIAEAVDTVIDETRSSVDELDELELPEGEAGETAERFVESLRSEVEDRGIPALRDLRGALRAGDEKGAQDAVERLRGLRGTDSDRFARELGAQACIG